jgi:hypothetical protein
MSSTVDSTLQVEAVKIMDSAALAGSSSATQYVSTWTPDNNAVDHNVIFPHGLGVVPSSVSILFSLDLKTVMPVVWRWNNNNPGNPVSIWMDDATVTLSIYSGSPLHGNWNGDTSLWTTSKTGYWRVIASV